MARDEDNEKAIAKLCDKLSMAEDATTLPMTAAEAIVEVAIAIRVHARMVSEAIERTRNDG